MKKGIASSEGKDDTASVASRKFILPRSTITPAAAPIAPIDTEGASERRPGSPHLSFSQLSMFLRCSFQYRFRYLLGMKERPKTSLSIGKGGHAALEWNAKLKLRTGTDADTDELVQKASDLMDFYLSEVPKSEMEVDVEPGGLKDKHLSATKIFRVRDAPKIQPIGAEVEFNLDMNEFQPEPLPEPIRIVNGKIDILYDDIETRVSHNDAVRVGVEDYKYVSRKKTVAEVNLSPQLTTYAVVVKKLTGHWPTKVGIRMMHPGTTRDPADSIPLLREPQHMTPEALKRRMARLAYQFRKMEEAIRNDIFIPTDDPITCSWCGFRDRCQSSLVDDFEAAIIQSKTTPPIS